MTVTQKFEEKYKRTPNTGTGACFTNEHESHEFIFAD